jgi:cytochrome bd ubiquinol oxidase subunit II
MSELTGDLVLAHLIGGAILVSLVAYVVMAGADFGGGVWDLLASGKRKEEHRRLIAHAIGPIWEANHVWLILVVVLLFTCFPRVFAELSVSLHIPLTLLLVGIVLRGSAFTFRTYDSQQDMVQRRWGLIFSIASVVTPVLLGICVGAVVAGNITPVHKGLSFQAAYVTPWFQAFPLAIGLLALTLFSFLAAVYLCIEAEDDAVTEDFRRRALVSGGVAFGVASVALLMSRTEAPLVWERVLSSWVALPLQAGVAMMAVATLWALTRRRYLLARTTAVVQVSLIVFGWALSQYPYLLPPRLTLAEAAAPPQTLLLVFIALVAGAVLLVPSLWLLFRIFKRAPDDAKRGPAEG